MRKAPAVVMLSLAVPVLSALPVLSTPQAAPRPVAPAVRSTALAGVDRSALGSPAGARSGLVAGQSSTFRTVPSTVPSTGPSTVPSSPAVLTGAEHTAPFQLLGVTWRTSVSPADLTVVVRAHATDGGWGEWTALDQQDTPTGPEAPARTGTEPLWVGSSDGYQVRVDLRGGLLPQDLRIDLVSPGDSPADSQVGESVPAARAAAAVSAPVIYDRAAWGADERLRSSAPRYSPTIKAGFVHHTAGTNHYSASDVPKIIRGIYAYHTKANGWSDIGYNFLVDRFGRLWEGRYGGITRPVLGAHTGGFNDNTFAVSAIGNFDTAAAPAAMVDSIARVLAWKLSRHYRDPNGTTVLTSTGGGTSRYPAGRRVRFNVISGHRDAGNTECPGTNLYRALGTIRSLTAGYLAAGLVSPTASSSRLPYASGTPLQVTARALLSQQWALEVRSHCGGTLVRRLTGSASPGRPVAATWDLRDSGGSPVRPGGYDVVLSSWDSSGHTARSWRHSLAVDAPATSAPVAPSAALPRATGFVPVDPVRVYDSRSSGRQPLGPGQRIDVRVPGVGGVPTTGVAGVAFTVTAGCPTRVTHLTIWPAGAPKPTASTLNLPAGATQSALVMTAVGGNGLVSIANASATEEVAVDVVGYYPVASAAGTPVGMTLHPIRPFRLFDSRQDAAGRLAPGDSRTLSMTAQGAVPPSAMGALLVNVTTAGATGTGSLTVQRPSAAPGVPVSSTYAPGGAVANRVVTALSASGQLQVTNRGASTHVVVDVVGWYAPQSVPGGAAFQPVTPTRVLDTRLGLGARKRPVGARSAIVLAVAGTHKVVPSGASAVVLNLTSTGASRATYLTAWPAGHARPTTSDLNVAAGRTIANLLVVRLGRTGTSAGRIDLYNNAGSTHLVGDVVGYYR